MNGAGCMMSESVELFVLPVSELAPADPGDSGGPGFPVSGEVQTHSCRWRHFEVSLGEFFYIFLSVLDLKDEKGHFFQRQRTVYTALGGEC